MDIRKAEILALTLIEKHLSDAKFDWQFEFNNTKRTFGQCVYGKKYGRPFHMIKLSKPLVMMKGTDNEYKIEYTIVAKSQKGKEMPECKDKKQSKGPMSKRTKRASGQVLRRSKRLANKKN